VLGYYEWKDMHCLIIQAVDESFSLGKGMSGSPVVQDDKLIGLVVGGPMWWYSGPRSPLPE